jgi:hypothetical protein
MSGAAPKLEPVSGATYASCEGTSVCPYAVIGNADSNIIPRRKQFPNTLRELDFSSLTELRLDGADVSKICDK